MLHTRYGECLIGRNCFICNPPKKMNRAQRRAIKFGKVGA